MDHAYSTTIPFQPLPPEVTATGARIVSYLHGGGCTVVLVGAPGSGKTTTLDAVLAGIPAWVERVSNRVVQPLTLPRILAQADAPPTADPVQSLLQTLRHRAGPDERGVLAVDDAHTLTPEALAALARIPGPGTVLILAGEPGLLPRLNTLAALRGPSVLTLRMPGRGSMATAAALSAPAAAITDAVETQPEPPRRRPYAAGLLVTAMTLTTALLAWPTQPEGNPARPTPEPVHFVAYRAPPPPLPEPALAPAPPPVEVAALPAPDTPPPEPETLRPVRPPVPDAHLRRGFEAFLDRAGRDTARLTPAAREGLFREYLAWKSVR